MPRKNFITHRISLSVQAISAFALAGLMVLLGGSEASARSCRTVYGHFINQVIVPAGPTCSSPVGFCVSGRAIGGLRGNFLSTTMTFTPAPNVSDTQVFFITANLVLRTRDGDLSMQENAASNQDPNGHGDLGNVVTVVGGTGKWAGATGRLRVWGNLTVNERDVNYEGEVCRP